MARHPIAEGFLRALTLAPGLVPLGMLFGAAAVAGGFSVAAAVALSAFVFAGGAQFATLGLVAGGAGTLSVAGLLFIINSRYLLLSAATLELGRKADARWHQRVALALGTVDESYALQAEWAKSALVGAAGLLTIPLTLWLCWTASTLAGALLGTALPSLEPYGLDYALPGIFVGLFGIFADTREKLVVGLVAIAIAGAFALAGQGTWAILVIPPVMAFGLGRWRPAR